MKEYIKETICSFVESENSERYWRTPLTGFADAESEYIRSLPVRTGVNHAMPCEMLPGARTVIVYFVPFSLEVNESNKVEGYASETWARAYERTNEMMSHLNSHIIGELEKRGYKASAASDSAVRFDREKLISMWSYRHLAYAAGLGTFGINRMIITQKGCSGRIGTVITDLDVEHDEPMKEQQCLYRKSGICGICMKNCVAKALEPGSFNRKACYEVCMNNAAKYKGFGDSYGGGIGSEVCGKCISFSPCAYRK